MKHFDKIDIIFIVLISIYLITLFVGILWIVLDKIEKKYWLPKKNVSIPVEEEKTRNKPTKTTNNSKSISKKTATTKTTKKPATSTRKAVSKATTTKKTTANANKTKTTTAKKQPNNSKRNTGYVSPTKRKKTNNRKKKKASKK